MRQGQNLRSPASRHRKGRLSANPLSGFVDADGDDLDVIFSGTPQYGTVTVDPETGAFSYVPHNLSAGQDVTDEFTYAVTDGTATTKRSP